MIGLVNPNAKKSAWKVLSLLAVSCGLALTPYAFQSELLIYDPNSMDPSSILQSSSEIEYESDSPGSATTTFMADDVADIHGLSLTVFFPNGDL